MQLSVTGHHVDVTPALRDYVAAKLQRLERHFDHVSDVHCILTVEKLIHKAEATIHLSGGTIHADSSKNDMSQKMKFWNIVPFTFPACHSHQTSDHILVRRKAGLERVRFKQRAPPGSISGQLFLEDATSMSGRGRRKLP